MHIFTEVISSFSKPYSSQPTNFEAPRENPATFNKAATENIKGQENESHGLACLWLLKAKMFKFLEVNSSQHLLSAHSVPGPISFIITITVQCSCYYLFHFIKEEDKRKGRGPGLLLENGKAIPASHIVFWQDSQVGCSMNTDLY